ncbi:hypothetical protein GUITHDRAFT_92824 [Guillardia theta CCMP2712]|uniref:Palmitoyltransferase n=1 Tax=Guillardia theta (strain CCMP2712) TaxID=905079 RepID=L1JRU8_GUITC|nr:hypothetical protein GUITHDRAFT_92824 [Guillardia theta CCMP2712]EKX50793.1 hypothetical protein GUITHDRAFT_92824 [Guillardia theta CCMP2712]|eukprot:XP_005837773.1 hypothetical protein GUITHDRAFT_92824 [Guillardia theta CCMP2712]
MEDEAPVEDGENSSITRTRVQPDGSTVVDKWCYTCKLWRPPRASHCRICKRCYYRFDHHCPITGTCIAQGTHIFFVSFLVLSSFACLVGCACGCWSIARLFDSNPEKKWQTFLLFPYMVVLAWIGISLAGFGICFHLALLICNTTTKEHLTAPNSSRKTSFCKDCIEISCVERHWKYSLDPKPVDLSLIP